MWLKATLLVLLCFLSANIFAEDLSLIFQVAKENKCTLTITQSSQSHFIHTPESQVFWCKKNDKNGYFDLVVNTQLTKEWSHCTSYIPVQSLSQSPIWISNNPQPYGVPLNVNEFWYLSDQANLSASKKVKESAIITKGSFSYGDFDAGQILYCHNGDWVYYGFH